MKLVGRRAVVPLIVIIGLLAALSTTFTALAVSVDGGTVMSLTCSSIEFNTSDLVIHYDRDNTGHGTEALVLKVIDGNGNVVFEGNDEQSIGTDQSFAPSYAFSTAPVANPLFARFFSPAGNGLDEQTILTAWFDCAGLPDGSLAGSGQRPPPGIPEGFVLRTIICDTAVYNLPAGQPVPGANITLGQTWYVSPDYVYGSDGKNWTQIFAGGYTNGWIETRCVG